MKRYLSARGREQWSVNRLQGPDLLERRTILKHQYQQLNAEIKLPYQKFPKRIVLLGNNAAIQSNTALVPENLHPDPTLLG